MGYFFFWPLCPIEPLVMVFCLFSQPACVNLPSRQAPGCPHNSPLRPSIGPALPVIPWPSMYPYTTDNTSMEVSGRYLSLPLVLPCASPRVLPPKVSAAHSSARVRASFLLPAVDCRIILTSRPAAASRPSPNTVGRASRTAALSPRTSSSFFDFPFLSAHLSPHPPAPPSNALSPVQPFPAVREFIPLSPPFPRYGLRPRLPRHRHRSGQRIRIARFASAAILAPPPSPLPPPGKRSSFASPRPGPPAWQQLLARSFRIRAPTPPSTDSRAFRRETIPDFPPPSPPSAATPGRCPRLGRHHRAQQFTPIHRRSGGSRLQ